MSIAVLIRDRERLWLLAFINCLKTYLSKKYLEINSPILELMVCHYHYVFICLKMYRTEFKRLFLERENILLLNTLTELVQYICL